MTSLLVSNSLFLSLSASMYACACRVGFARRARRRILATKGGSQRRTRAGFCGKIRAFIIMMSWWLIIWYVRPLAKAECWIRYAKNDCNANDSDRVSQKNWLRQHDVIVSYPLSFSSLSDCAVCRRSVVQSWPVELYGDMCKRNRAQHTSRVASVIVIMTSS